LALRPQTEVAERVLLPGDPGRALRLAQLLTDKPLMLNHHRGLWGYTGLARDGAPLTVQATGIGGPSAAIVLEALIGLGARRFVRVGSCRALNGDLHEGELIAVGRALKQDGTSRALEPDGDYALADAALTAALSNGASRAGTVVSADRWLTSAPDGALAADLQSAAVLTLAARHGLPAGALLAVGEPGEAAEEALGRAAFEALTP
jgi:uridine phosphorylase